MVLSRIQQLATSGLSIIMACHFPEHAFLYGTKALLFKEGRVYGFGVPDATVTKENIKALYGVEVKIAEVDTGQGNTVKVCVPCHVNSHFQIPLRGRKNVQTVQVF
jgi:ABC-type cobalamin/Fe3+-siderophores transport system ATPase subunit